MRWLVEVTALGKSDKESLSIDADSWQKALQAARAKRGDTAPMSGFSIELLDEGCRAVDPMSRIRYEVRKAADDGGASRSQAPRPASVPAPAAPAAAHPPSAPAPAAPAAAPASVAPKKAVPAASPVRTAVAAPVAGPAGGSVAPAVAARPSAPHPAPPAVSVPSAPPVAVPAAAPAAPVAPAVHHADVAAQTPMQILFKREQDPTESVPLTYREYVFLIAPGTSEAAAETYLATNFELVRAALERLPAGKLVNLAVFDVAFQGKPPVPPLATLSWKDWRGAPVVGFPRRAHAPAAAAPAPVVQAPAAFVAAPAPVEAPVPQPPLGSAPPPAPAYVPPAPPPPAYASAPPPAPAFPQVAPAPVAVASPFVPQAQAFAAPPAPDAAFAPPAVAPTFQPAGIPAAPPLQPAPARQPSSGNIRPGARVRGEDLIADLFEAMHELHFLPDAVAGGEFCLTLAMEKIPSQAGIVHVYDIDRREFLVTSTRGQGAQALLLRRHAEGDPLLHAAMNKRRSIVLADATKTEASMLERYGVLGGARSLIVAPVMQHGRFLGAVEMLNPLDGAPYTEAEGNALNYIAEQFAEFLAAHGVVTDPERIGARAPQA